MAYAENEGEAGSGVQALIDRLREQGVASGRQEAERLIAEAERQAEAMRAEARAEVAAMKREAEAEAGALKKAAEEAVSLAARDAVLELKGRLTGSFTERLRRIVGHELSDKELLRRLILQIAGQNLPEDTSQESLQIMLPREAIGLDEIRREPEKAEHGSLAGLALDIAADMLRDGVELSPDATWEGSGLFVRLVEKDIEVQLDDAAIAERLRAHLLPRFRALLEGVIH